MGAVNRSPYPQSPYAQGPLTEEEQRALDLQMLQQSMNGVGAGSADVNRAPAVLAPTKAMPFAEEKQTDTAVRNKSEQTPVMITQPQENSAITSINRRDAESFAAQQAGIGNLEKLLGTRRALKPQLDLSPLAALVDAQTGSNFSKTYQRPESPEERADQILKLEGMIQEKRSGISKNDLGYFKALFPGAYNTVKTVDTNVDTSSRTNKPQKGSETKLKVLPDQAVNRITDAQSGLTLITKLRQDVSDHPTYMGTGKGLISGLTSALGTDLGSDKIAAMQNMQNEFGVLQQRVGKALEGGVLRKEDEIKYNRLLGSLGRDPRVTAKNLDELYSMISRDLTNHIKNHGAAKYDVSGFTDLASQPATPPALKAPAPAAGNFKTVDEMNDAELKAYVESNGKVRPEKK